MTDGVQDAPSPAIIVETRDAHAAVVRLNRPSERNALSVAVLRELDEKVSALISDTNLSSIIFTGTNDAFASGANIRELQTLSTDSAREFAALGQRLMRKIADAPQLTIAAVNGFCMGGGLDLALSCDVRCAVPRAIFAHPGARLGIITGWGGTQRLAQLIGSARAFEMFLTARKISGAEALEIGLVNRLGENALNCALEISRRHAKRKGDG